MVETTTEIKNNFYIKWGLRTKFNFYLSLIVIVTIIIFDFIVTRFYGNTIIVHSIHIIVTVLLIIALMNILFSKLILNPIKNLIESIKGIEQGEFFGSYDLKNIHNDEIGYLVLIFIKMRTELQNFIRLQKKDSASAISYRTWNELHDPLANLKINIELLKKVFDSIKLEEKRKPLQLIINNIEKDYLSIRDYTEEARSIFTEDSV